MRGVYGQKNYEERVFENGWIRDIHGFSITRIEKIKRF